MPDKTKLIIFDKDGVILDLEATWLPVARAVAHYTASRLPVGWQTHIGASDLLAAIGVDEAKGIIDSRGIFAAGSFADIRDCWQAMLPPSMIRLDQDEQYRQDVKALVVRHGHQNTVPKGDVLTPLNQLYEAGYQLAMVTNDNEASARQSLVDLGVHDLFATVVGADSGHGSKPGGGGLLYCCEQAQITPDQCIMVGDTMADYGAARAARAGGFVAVANSYDERPHPDIDHTHVIAALTSLPELMAYRSGSTAIAKLPGASIQERARP